MEAMSPKASEKLAAALSNIKDKAKKAGAAVKEKVGAAFGAVKNVGAKAAEKIVSGLGAMTKKGGFGSGIRKVGTYLCGHKGGFGCWKRSGRSVYNGEKYRLKGRRRFKVRLFRSRRTGRRSIQDRRRFCKEPVFLGAYLRLYGK